MAVLVLNAGTASPISLTVQSAGENAPTEVGSVTPSFNLVDRSSVRGVKRNYGSMTSIVDTATKDSIINLLKWGNQIPCSGDLLGNTQTQCTVRYTAAPMKAGLGGSFWEVGLTLSEVQPNNILLRYSPGDAITGESFTRSTTATYKNTSGVVATAAINVKRDFHWNTALGFRTLLLEDTRINEFWPSEDFSHANWVKSALTISTTAPLENPKAGVTSNKLQEDNTNSAHTVTSAAMTTTTNTDQAVSVFAHYGERTWLRISSISRAGTVRNSWVNLSTGAIGTKDAGHTIRVEAFYNNWFRVEMVFNADAGGGTVNAFFSAATADNVTAYVGTTGSGIYLFGAQHEKDRSFASSYIPTTTVAVTRGADSYSLPFTTPPQEMTVYAKFVEGGTIGGASGVFELSNSGAADPRLLGLATGGVYATYHGTTVTSVVSYLGVAPIIGNTVELAFRLFGDGSVDTTQSIGGAASTASIQSAALALAPAWSGLLCWLNSAGAAAVGFTALQSFKIVAGARSLAEMRAA